LGRKMENNRLIGKFCVILNKERQKLREWGKGVLRGGLAWGGGTGKHNRKKQKIGVYSLGKKLNVALGMKKKKDVGGEKKGSSV